MIVHPRCSGLRSPDRETLAAGYDGVGVVLWNVATGEKRATFPGQTSQIRCLAFSATVNLGIGGRGIKHPNLGCRDGNDEDHVAWAPRFDLCSSIRT